MKRKIFIVAGLLFISLSCKKEVSSPSLNNVTNPVDSTKVVKLDTTVVKDVEGNSYKILKIGNQFWLAENLKTFKYNDGTLINLIVSDSLWITDTLGAVCHYNNVSENSKIYGAMYNWYAVKTNKLCPSGWKVPSSSDWDTLSNFLGGDQISGSKLKEVGTQLWSTSNENVTNEFGFTALPTGTRNQFGFFSQGVVTYWWSTYDDGYDGLSASVRGVYHSFDVLANQGLLKTTGLPVRCVKK
jgi:uncharacterized protein (TIGR02145 family)